MKLSHYFDDLFSSYNAEIDDLTFDSGGADVLAKRLKDKRSQLGELMPMAESYPVMVAPAFRGAFSFDICEVLDQIVAGAPGALPAWETVAATLVVEPWAEGLVKKALSFPGGDEFLVTVAGLEYIWSRPEIHAAVDNDTDAADDDDDTEDLGDAGEDWLGDQGFDRRS